MLTLGKMSKLILLSLNRKVNRIIGTKSIRTDGIILFGKRVDCVPAEAPLGIIQTGTVIHIRKADELLPFFAVETVAVPRHFRTGVPTGTERIVIVMLHHLSGESVNYCPCAAQMVRKIIIRNCTGICADNTAARE